jgi:hypothetical protein
MVTEEEEEGILGEEWEEWAECLDQQRPLELVG